MCLFINKTGAGRESSHHPRLPAPLLFWWPQRCRLLLSRSLPVPLSAWLSPAVCTHVKLSSDQSSLADSRPLPFRRKMASAPRLPHCPHTRFPFLFLSYKCRSKGFTSVMVCNWLSVIFKTESPSATQPWLCWTPHGDQTGLEFANHIPACASQALALQARAPHFPSCNSYSLWKSVHRTAGSSVVSSHGLLFGAFCCPRPARLAPVYHSAPFHLLPPESYFPLPAHSRPLFFLSCDPFPVSQHLPTSTRTTDRLFND